MSTEINRLLMELERVMRDVNREVINPHIPHLHIADLDPALRLVAEARAEYLSAFFSLHEHKKDGKLGDEQIKRLHRLRIRYEELVEGAKALETAIQRGYLDITTP